MSLEGNFHSIQRKIHNVEYTHTALPEGYEAAEEQYRHCRDHLTVLKDCTVGLSTYEHGGKTMKSIKEGLTAIGKRLKDDHFKNDSIYAGLSAVGHSLQADLPSGTTTTAAGFSTAYQQIDQAKVRMNVVLEAQVLALSALQKQTESIDKMRIQVKNLRYDLEIARQATPPKDSAKLEQEYDDTSKSTLASMTSFIGDNGMDGILQKITAAHREFAEREVEALKNIG